MSTRQTKQKSRKMLAIPRLRSGWRAILVLALGLMVWSAPIVQGDQSLTVNGKPVDSITLKVGQSCTVEVVSETSTPYNAYVGFDNGVVLGDFSHLRTMPEAGNLASATVYNVPEFSGYFIVAAGSAPPPSAGVHFVFQYQAQVLGETDLQLYDGIFSLVDSVHITVVHAEMGTSFTYQGSLNDAGSPADGLYDFEFELYDAPSDGNQLGSTIDINDLDVIEGQFTVELDFGSDVFNGDARWLETTVAQSDGSDPATLTPRVELTPTPYALYAKRSKAADDADKLDGLDSTAFAAASHSHGGVYALIGHTHSGSDITTGTVADARIASSIARDSELTWGNLANIPAGFADGVDNDSGGDITAVNAGTGLSGGGTSGNVTLNVDVPLSLSGSSSSPIISGTNTGTGYAGHFGQTGSSNAYGGLNVTTAAGRYGAKILNQGGYSGYSYGLRADATSTNSSAYGGYFRANAGGSYSHGIYIDADNTRATAGGYNYGIKLYSDSTNGQAYGIFSDVGVGSGSTSTLYGIYSYGSHLGTAGTSYGMYSRVYGSDTGDSYGIYSEGRKYSSDTDGTAYGGYFIGDNDRTGGESYGLYTKATGLNGHRYGLYSEVTTSSGYYNNYGLYTEVSNNDYTSYGLYADLEPGKGGSGVYVDLDTTTASTSSQHGLYSDVRHNGTGGNVYGVRSYTYSSNTGTNYAGFFNAYSSSGDTGNLYGIRAYCDNDTSGSKYAGYFYKSGKGDYAGYFYGNVHVQGTLTKSSGSFKIDHPLDPENKYLSHSFVESPDMMNVYNGNAALDENGEACVQLPEYFEALNQDFRYQLTCIGGFAPVYIAEKISDNRFKIAGGKAGMEVSWQVTGVRDDPYAVAHRVQVEEEKNNEERGYYLNPMAYGLPEEKGIESVRNPRVSETRQVAKGDVSYETD